MKSNSKRAQPHRREADLPSHAGLKAGSKVTPVRRRRRLAPKPTVRQVLRGAYRQASRATRASVEEEIREVDHLTAEGLAEVMEKVRTLSEL